MEGRFATGVLGPLVGAHGSRGGKRGVGWVRVKLVVDHVKSSQG